MARKNSTNRAALFLPFFLALALARPAAAAESLRVGYLGPLTGIFAQAGKDMLDGIKMAFDELGYQTAGRKIELIAEDSEGNPGIYKRVAAIAMDNGFGHEGIGGFQRVFEDQGGRVVQKIWVPLNALDFAPYLSQVPKDVDAVVQVLVAAQTVRFAKQYAEFGLKERVPLIGTGVFTDESALRGMGDEAIGIVTSLIWAPTLATPANQRFMKLAEAKLQRSPAYFHAVMYSAGRWLAEAARLVDGQVEDRDRFLAAIRKASESIEDPRGPNPGEFLKTPPYDRGYPPVKP